MENYSINTDFFNADERTFAYEAAKKGSVYGLIQNGHKQYRVYTRQLFQILSNDKIPCFPSGEVNGCIFKGVYIKGYEKGVFDFKNEYGIKPDTLFANADQYIRNLHLCYFHKAPNLDKGWYYWVNSYPIIVNEKAIDLYGYVAGICAEIDIQKEQYPGIFQKFEDCPDNDIEQKLDSLTKNNATFDGIMKDFEEKIKTISQFMSEDEFLKEEIVRVENEYSDPQIHILSSNHPIIAQFSYSKYTKEAFNWLKRGQNWPLKNIIANAEIQYREAYKDSPRNIDQHFQSGEFEKAIIMSLKEGVAWLMYTKHIKDLLDQKIPQAKAPVQENLISTLKPINSLALIDTDLIDAFLRVEKMATSNTSKFESAIRCAAFCELLYKKRYIINIKQQNQKQMNSFAKSRYGIDIRNALSTKDKEDREKHKNKAVKSLQPLVWAFL